MNFGGDKLLNVVIEKVSKFKYINIILKNCVGIWMKKKVIDFV